MIRTSARRLTRLASLLAPLASPLVPAASAQGGYVTEKHPELGLTFSRARDYHAVPIQPGEPWIVLYYAEKEAFNPRERKRFRPELRFVWIDHHPAPPTVEPPDSEQGSGERDEQQGQDGGSTEEAEAAPVPIHDFESYVEQRLTHWDLGIPEQLKERSKHRSLEYELSLSDGSVPLVGLAFSYSNDERTVAAFGICAREDQAEQVKIWRKMLSKLKLTEPEERDDTKLVRYYERRDFAHPEYRIAVRNKLVKGWEAEDSENYILVFSTKDEPLIRLIKSELEAIRKEYVERFRPVREIRAVSTVRICRDEAEYLKYGGPRGSAGYWNSQTEELVFYDAENTDGKAGSGKADTRIVLYHEAFHQYIYYAIGQVAPHSWFNEGTGDYFSGAIIKGGKVRKIGVNPWRAAYIKAVASEQRGAPRPLSFKTILNYTQAEFYQRAGLCYAQAWSMVYFLRTAPEVRKHDVWSQILGTYFDTLQQRFADELGSRDAGELDPEALEVIKLKAREAALKRAFADVDLLELQRAWQEYTADLKLPR